VNGNRSLTRDFGQIKNMWVKGYLASNKNEGRSNLAPAFSDLIYRLLTFVLRIELGVHGNTQVYHRLPDVDAPLRISTNNKSGFRSDPFLSPRSAPPRDAYQPSRAHPVHESARPPLLQPNTRPQADRSSNGVTVQNGSICGSISQRQHQHMGSTSLSALLFSPSQRSAL
jgi:hypothetical protein